MLTNVRDTAVRDTAASALIAAGGVAVAAIIGGSFGPQQPKAAAWYASLRKPPATPPGPAIGAIWMILYGLLGVSGTRLLRARPSRARNGALVGWAATLLGIAAFPWTFFGRKRLGESTVVSAGLLAASAGGTAAAWEADRPSALCMLPVPLWVTLATVFSEELWRRNR
jgi:tryptophan-rich sensory protein